MIGDFIDIKDLDNIVSLDILTPEEAELFKYLKNKELSEVTVVLRDGKPIRLELTEVDYNADISKRVYEDMLGSDYVECRYVTNTKKQVTFTRTTKVKL